MNQGAPPASNRESGSGPLVFVLDDEPSVKAVMLSVLQAHGFRVVLFSDPREALAALRQGGAMPAVLITDHLMPHLSGLALIREAKALHPALKTILCTGETDFDESEQVGVRPDRVLEKPFGARLLVEMVRKLATPPPAPASG
jgi:DNA-binding NtrC family response regulator